ncbi:MAG TPA: methyltransferase type 11, partial [Anaeromyxobacteraceae bacterium]|nr:methyltransferase type 11 [Anaeromyxobacteraceae bacterium]
MSSFYAPHGAADLLSRYSFIEPILGGRRVLEIGAARATDGASALALAERGAAAVLSVEDDGLGLGRAGELSSHPFVQFRAAALEELPRRAFDLVLVADGAALAASPERLAALAELLTPRGHLVTSLAAAGTRGLAALAGDSPATEVPSYESFAGALAAQFDVVEMATQSPAVGWVIAPAAHGDDAPDLGVDGALSGAPEAAYYVALCGARPTGLDTMVLVTLPPAPLAEAALQSAAAARAHAGCAEALATREAELARSAAAGAEAEARAGALEEVIASLRGELGGAAARQAELSAQLDAERSGRAEVVEALARTEGEL